MCQSSLLASHRTAPHRVAWSLGRLARLLASHVPTPRASVVARPPPSKVAALTLLSSSETELSLQQHLNIAPDLLASYGRIAADAGDQEPLMMAQSVPHQTTDRRRVKVYELRDNDWFDRGTGFCTATWTEVCSFARNPLPFSCPLIVSHVSAQHQVITMSPSAHQLPFHPITRLLLSHGLTWSRALTDRRGKGQRAPRHCRLRRRTTEDIARDQDL